MTVFILVPGAVSRAAAPQPAPVRTFKFSLSDEGVLIVDNARVKLGDLSKKLKSLGVKPDTALMIAVPAATTEGTLKALSAELGSKGYRRFLFTKPQHTLVSVGTNAVTR